MTSISKSASKYTHKEFGDNSSILQLLFSLNFRVQVFLGTRENTKEDSRSHRFGSHFLYFYLRAERQIQLSSDLNHNTEMRNQTISNQQFLVRPLPTGNSSKDASFWLSKWRGKWRRDWPLCRSHLYTGIFKSRRKINDLWFIHP